MHVCFDYRPKNIPKHDRSITIVIHNNKILAQVKLNLAKSSVQVHILYTSGKGARLRTIYVDVNWTNLL